jgi:hypothetical protein
MIIPDLGTGTQKFHRDLIKTGYKALTCKKTRNLCITRTERYSGEPKSYVCSGMGLKKFSENGGLCQFSQLHTVAFNSRLPVQVTRLVVIVLKNSTVLRIRIRDPVFF